MPSWNGWGSAGTPLAWNFSVTQVTGCRHSWKERKHLANLVFVGLATVFRDLKSLRVLNVLRLRTVALPQGLPPLRLQLSLPSRRCRQPFLPLRWIFWHLLQHTLSPWQPLVEL